MLNFILPPSFGSAAPPVGNDLTTRAPERGQKNSAVLKERPTCFVLPEFQINVSVDFL